MKMISTHIFPTYESNWLTSIIQGSKVERAQRKKIRGLHGINFTRVTQLAIKWIYYIAKVIQILNNINSEKNKI